MSKRLKILTKKELKKSLQTLDGWSTNPKQTILYKTFMFNEHVNALVFIARVTVHAEVKQHHPDVEFGYCKVKIKLTTHDVKGLTKKDIYMAMRVEQSFTSAEDNSGR